MTDITPATDEQIAEAWANVDHNRGLHYMDWNTIEVEPLLLRIRQEQADASQVRQAREIEIRRAEAAEAEVARLREELTEARTIINDAAPHSGMTLAERAKWEPMAYHWLKRNLSNGGYSGCAKSARTEPSKELRQLEG